MGNYFMKGAFEPAPIYRSPSEEEIDKLKNKVLEIQGEGIGEKLTSELIQKITLIQNSISEKESVRKQKSIDQKYSSFINENRQKIRQLITSTIIHDCNAYITSSTSNNSDFIIYVRYESDEMFQLHSALKNDDEFGKFMSHYEMNNYQRIVFQPSIVRKVGVESLCSQKSKSFEV